MSYFLNIQNNEYSMPLRQKGKPIILNITVVKDCW